MINIKIKAITIFKRTLRLMIVSADAALVGLAKAVFIVIILISLGMVYYFFGDPPDRPILGYDHCLRIASAEVLGNSLYGKTCPRAFYDSNVVNLNTSEKSVDMRFRFFPIASKEAECPPVTVSVDRRNGDAWIEK